MYLDETWINAHHTNEREWQSVDGSIKRLVPSSKGRRLIIAHAGSRENGLLENGELVFQSKSTDNRDYHEKMNGHVFRNWIEKTVIPALDRPSCLVMDNASYHNSLALEGNVPTSSTNKTDIKVWLTKENIHFNEMSLKSELLNLVRNANRKKIFQIDNILHENGHICLRLPPYHSHLNPIELVWAKVKGQVASQNTTFKIGDVKKLTHDALSNIDKEYWIKCEDHVLKEEQKYWENDGLQFIQPVTGVNITDSSDTDECENHM